MIKTKTFHKDNRYIVYSDGRIFSTIYNMFRKHKFNHKGYPMVQINRKNHTIHRMVAIAFVPNPDNLPQVNHIDGNKLNNNDWNLEWCTPKQNKAHAIINGLYGTAKGEKNGNSRLTDQQVIEIKKHLSDGLLSQWAIANIYSVWQGTISAIKNGKFRK